MARTLGLVSCSKTKMNYPCKASEMYSPSYLFRKSFAYATRNYDLVGILSAKYGFLFPDDIVEPYDLTLKSMNTLQRKEWSRKVFNMIGEKLDLDSYRKAYFHTGKEYREYLIPLLRQASVECIIPLEGLTFGQQLKWYADHA